MSNPSVSLVRAISIVKSLPMGTRFYASDFGFAGGTMQGLRASGYVKRTENSKIFLLNIYDNHYIEVETLEWEVCDTWEEKYRNIPTYKWVYDNRNKNFDEMAKMIVETAEILKKMGY